VLSTVYALLYLSPVWVMLIYYFASPKVKKNVAYLILLAWLVSIPVLLIDAGTHIFGFRAGVYNVLIWQSFFGAVLCLIVKKKYSLEYGVYMAFFALAFASEVWEITVHFITVSHNPTLGQVFVTATMSIPYLATGIPLTSEFRKHGIKDAIMSLVLNAEVPGFIFVGLLTLCATIDYPPVTAIFAPDGYLTDLVTYAMRIGTAAYMLWLFSLMEELKGEGGTGNA